MKSPKISMLAQGVGAKVSINANGAMANQRPHNNMEKSWGKEFVTKKAKWHLTKVMCFNYDNHGHLAKDYFEPLQVCDCITKVKWLS